MNVLIISKNIFKRAGGGETVYKSIIRHLSDYNFYYPSDDLSAEKRPKNARPYLTKKNIEINFDNLLNPGHLENLLIPFKNMSFDIIDIPDYQPVGLHLKETLNSLSIKYKKIVLSLHGVMSSYFFYDWKRDFYLNHNKNQFNQIKLNELKQEKLANFVYGISEKYSNEKYHKSSVRIIDPLYLLFKNSPILKRKNNLFPTNKTIQLVFVGRLDRQKAPDILIDTILMLHKNHKYKIIFYAPKDESAKIGDKTLKQMALRRNINIRIEYNKKTNEIFEEIRKKNSIVIIPSRVDSFNIIALEALLNEVPILIRNTCGVTNYLNRILGKKFILYNFWTLNDLIYKINTISSNLKKAKEDVSRFKKILVGHVKDHKNVNPYIQRKRKHNLFIKHPGSSTEHIFSIKEILSLNKIYNRQLTQYQKNLQINLFIKEINFYKIISYLFYIFKNKGDQKINISIKLISQKTNLLNIIKITLFHHMLNYKFSKKNHFQKTSVNLNKDKLFLYCQGLPYLSQDFFRYINNISLNNLNFKIKNINIQTNNKNWFEKDTNLKSFSYVSEKEYFGDFDEIQKIINLNNKFTNSNLLIRVDN